DRLEDRPVGRNRVEGRRRAPHALPSGGGVPVGEPEGLVDGGRRDLAVRPAGDAADHGGSRGRDVHDARSQLVGNLDLCRPGHRTVAHDRAAAQGLQPRHGGPHRALRRRTRPALSSPIFRSDVYPAGNPKGAAMFRFFESLVDPYVAYEEKDAPPRRLLPFLMEYSRPFRGVFLVTAALKCVSAALDVALIWYVGRMVDLLSQGTPAEVVESHGTEFVLAALVVLIVRPIVSGIDVALL